MIDLLKRRRSIRKYKDIPVENEKIKKILMAAMMAPSSRGRKPWKFTVVKEKDLLNRISNCRTKGGGPFLKNAPLAIVVSGDTSISDMWIEDCSIAASYIQLQAHDDGLGSCWVQVREREHDENKSANEYLKEVLNLEDKYSVLCIIGIGYSDEKKEEHQIKDIEARIEAEL